LYMLNYELGFVEVFVVMDRRCGGIEEYQLLLFH